MMNSKQLKTQSGSTLIEVLIAMIIAAIGLSGMAALQLRALAEHRIAHYRVIANDLNNELAEHIRNSYRLARDGQVVRSSPTISAQTAGTQAPDCETQACSQQDIFNYNLAKWTVQLNARLPAAGYDIRWIDKPNPVVTLTPKDGVPFQYDTGPLPTHPTVVVSIIWAEPELNATSVDRFCAAVPAFQTITGKRCISNYVVM